MRNRKSGIFGKSLALMMGVAMLSFLACNSGSDKTSGQESRNYDISGAGASFPAPLVTAMADEYRTETDNRVTVNYQSIGSGGGIRQFQEQTIMFGMTEAYLSDEIMEKIKNETDGKAFNIPITLADVVVTYNLSGIGKGLVFDGNLLVDIFMGRVERWNDPSIAELNPDKDLPDTPVTVVHRSDGSGTTNLFTSYLSSVSDEWRQQVGYSTSVNWPAGVGGNGNEGVAGVIMNTPGAIGYNSLSYALLNDLAYGYIMNSSGNVIEPTYSSTTAAADIDLPDDTRVLFTNTPAPEGYPIAGFTWMLVYENLDHNKAIDNKQEAEELVKFIIWSMTDGQQLAEGLGYAQLPEAVVEKNIEMISQLKWEGENIGQALLKEKGLI